MASSAYYSGCDYDDYEPHFLDCCSLCRRPLSQNNDIFMYRGDTPFCSQDCRQEQIEIDEASEKKMKKLSSSSKRSNTARQTTSESAKEYDAGKSLRNGTVAVA